MTSETETLITAKAPWTCKAQVYSLFLHTSPPIPPIAYDPLEQNASFASPEYAGRFLGGPAGLTVIRYTETPVGPYDELIIIPGTYAWGQQQQNPRISRIYVSQRHAMYNGRLHWNIPKHLARFEWVEDPTTTTTTRLKVFLPQEGGEDASAAQQGTAPFFQASFRTVPYVPSFPFSTAWAKYFGMDFTLVQPPLPEAGGEEAACVGTDQWCAFETTQASRRTHLVWWDLSQREGGEGSKFSGLFENFWPGLGRWRLGVRMDDATVEIPEGKHFLKE